MFFPLLLRQFLTNSWDQKRSLLTETFLNYLHHKQLTSSFMQKLSIQKALIKFIQNSMCFGTSGNEFNIEWLQYSSSPLVLLRVKSQEIIGEPFPISLASRGVLTMHLLESFTHFPPLISIKSCRNVSCLITWKKILSKPKKSLLKCAISYQQKSWPDRPKLLQGRLCSQSF